MDAFSQSLPGHAPKTEVRSGYFRAAAHYALVAAFCGCASLAVLRVASNTALPPFYVAQSGSVHGYPVVAELVPWFATEASKLQPGDIVISIDGENLRDVDAVAIYSVFARTGAAGRELGVVFKRGGEQYSEKIRGGSRTMYWPTLAAALVFAGTAILIFGRARSHPMIRAFYAAFMAAAFVLVSHFVASPAETYVALSVSVITHGVVFPLTLRERLAFPDGHPPVGRVLLIAPWALLVVGPLHLSALWGIGLPRSVGVPGTGWSTISFLLMAIVLVSRTWENQSSAGREHMRWMQLGLYLGAIPVICATGLVLYDAANYPWLVASLATLALYPIGLVVSLWRYRLYDIVRLVGTREVRLAEVAGVVTLEALIVPLLFGPLEAVSLLPTWLNVLLLTVTPVLCLIALERLAKRSMDRRKYPESSRLREGLAGLLSGLERTDDEKQLIEGVATGLSKLLGDTSSKIYSGQGFVEADLEAPFERLNSRDERNLCEHEGIGGKAVLADCLCPLGYEGVVLTNLKAEAAVVVWVEGELFTLIALGAKPSRHVYTNEDCEALARVADALRTELLRRAAHRKIVLWRSKVDKLGPLIGPEPRARFHNGSDLGPIERETTVLSVTSVPSRNDGRIDEARELQVVTEIIAEQGGRVFAIQEGIVALFDDDSGPRRKEQRALEAGLQIERALLPGGEGAHVACGGRTGIGIATGPAHIGEVKVAGYSIWGALGYAPSLASSLRERARETEAVLVADLKTMSRCDEYVRFAVAREVRVALPGFAEVATAFVRYANGGCAHSTKRGKRSLSSYFRCRSSWRRSGRSAGVV